jgi:DNA-directed RNA polymerase sigma subunit (sigma70/sigma32)
LLDLPLAQDDIALLALEQNPDGMPLDAIAQLYGVSGELIRLIEQKALKRLACALQRAA